MNILHEVPSVRLQPLSPIEDDLAVSYDVLQTEVFQTWVTEIRDQRAKAKVLLRAQAVAQGNFGDRRSVGNGVSEMRIHYGPGYRLYYTVRRQSVVFLLVGGEKKTQKQDITRAKELAQEL